MRMITDVWGMAVMIRSAPRRHKGHGTISRANTRPRNLAQLQEGVAVFATSPSTPCWRDVGLIAPRSALCGAQQPAERTGSIALDRVLDTTTGVTSGIIQGNEAGLLRRRHL